MTQNRTMKIVRPMRRGQITIPTAFRKRLGIADDTLLQLTLGEHSIEITPLVVASAEATAWARELYEMLAEVRQEAATRTEDEIDADIAAAIREVRQSRR